MLQKQTITIFPSILEGFVLGSIDNTTEQYVILAFMLPLLCYGIDLISQWDTDFVANASTQVQWH